MAGPWTISRDRQDGESGTGLWAAFGRIGSRSRRTPLPREARVRFRSAERDRGAATGPVRSPGSLPARVPVRARRAVPLLVMMTAAAVLLAWATVSVARKAITAAQAANKMVAGPLLVPAPRTAGALPRRFGARIDPAAAKTGGEFHHRFAAVSSALIAAAERAAGSTAAGQKITAVMPSGLYGEPGHIDPATGRPAWILYLGLQATGTLGQPSASVTSLMTGILGRWSRVGSWQVPAGHRGGAASCTIARLDQTAVSVCGWATDRTIGAIASPTRDTSVGELATLMLRMRFDLQRR